MNAESPRSAAVEAAPMRIAVLGAGAWGTALAAHAARQHAVSLWMRDAALARAIRATGRNERYLPGIDLPAALDALDSLDAVCAAMAEGPSLAVLATPMAALGSLLSELVPRLPAACAGVLWLCKGIEADTMRLPHQVAHALLRGRPGAALAGPSFAQEVALGLPVALTVAGPSADLARLVVRAFHHGGARIYSSEDIVGVELGGALKNVMAIAAGICDGLELGTNARAALVTRGLAEITRLGLAMGAQAETFTGLTGLGDLVLTCTGSLSRNRRVGLGLAAGTALSEVLAGLGHVAEGVACAPVAQALARRHGVQMPILDAVCTVLSGELSARAAVLGLLAREPRPERS